MAFDFNILITTRTLDDFKKWLYLRNKGYSAMTDEEKAEWNSGTMKGSYNISDLNRVGEALNYLRDALALASYIPPLVFTAKTNWTTDDIPTAEDFSYYINAVSVIREALAQFATTPPTPADTGGLDFNEANDIEKILIDVNILLNNMLAARYYAGEIFAGEV